MRAFSLFEGGALVWIQEHLRASWLNGPVVFITHLGDTGAIWIALTLLLLILPKTRKVGIVSAASMVINLILTNIALKNIIQRIRPYEIIDSLNILIEAQHDFSFPLGHTACSFAAAWVFWRMAPKKYSVPAMILAVLISLSRLYVGVHFPTDILGGLVVGVFSAELAWRLLNKRLNEGKAK